MRNNSLIPYTYTKGIIIQLKHYNNHKMDARGSTYVKEC